MTRRLKILMLTTQLGYGGAETSFIRLANLLAESMDVTVALFTRDYGAGSWAHGHEKLNATIQLLDKEAPCGRLSRWWRRISEMRRLKKQHDATISFLSGPNVVNVLAGGNASTIISLRGSRVYDPVLSRLSRLLFQHFLDRIAFHLAASIVVVSPGLKNEIRQVTGEKTLEKVSVISPFVEVSTLQNRLAEPVPEPYGQLKGQKVVVAVGRLSVEKGFHHLIRVFAALPGAHKGAKLLLVGDGPMMQSLRTLCAELGLAMDDTTPGVTSVVFAGYQKNALPLIALGTVYAMTSATEGLPNVVLEAMAAGVPVVAANTPWGARAVLSEQAELSREPYPSQKATQADYGILMPRIDEPQYREEWAQTLAKCLDANDGGACEKGLKRVRDYDLSVVGVEWKRLIERLAGL